MQQLTFSFLPLTDAAPLIVAHDRGFFREHGIESSLRRETSWTASRDSLMRGSVHAAHMLFSMPVAAACGLLGGNESPLVIPWVLSRNGQGISMNRSFMGVVKGDPRMLRQSVIEGRNAGRPLVFGHTLRVGTHAMLLRYWLAAGGIDPENDVALITVPPSQMVENLRGGRMHGFCVGEPWNARAQVAQLGYTAITSGEIWPGHPEKVCAFTEAFARERPDAIIAALKALWLAGEWLERPENHDSAAALLARPEYLNCQVSDVRDRLGGFIDYGDGRTRQLDARLRFAGPSVNRPRESHAIWFLTQFRRWGLLFGEPAYGPIAASVIRTDLYEEVVAAYGINDPAPVDGPETFFDGRVFDPDEPAAYLNSLECVHLQG